MEVRKKKSSPGPLDYPDTPLTTIGTDPTKTPPRPISRTNTDHAQGNSKISTIATMEPFVPMKKIKNKINFDDLYGPPKWTKYFEIESSTRTHFHMLLVIFEHLNFK